MLTTIVTQLHCVCCCLVSDTKNECIQPFNLVHFWLHHTVHCVEKIVSACLRADSVSAGMVGQGEVGGVTRKGDLHMVDARLGCERVMAGTRWPTSRPECLTNLQNTTLAL